MHDLNTINRLNAEAFSKAITTYRGHGRYVLARYDGLTLMSIETFSSAEDGALALVQATESASASERFDLLSPLPGWHAAKRDQSEDRPTPDPRTLAGYIANVQRQEA